MQSLDDIRKYKREWMRKKRKRLYKERDKQLYPKVVKELKKHIEKQAIARKYGISVRLVAKYKQLSTG